MKNRNSILLFVLILLLTGCKAKAPNNVNQQFYDDMLFCINDLKELIPTLKGDENGMTLTEVVLSEGHLKFVEYEDNIDSLNIKERKILGYLDEVYLYTMLYYDMVLENKDPLFGEDLEKNLYNFSELMEIELDIGDFIL